MSKDAYRINILSHKNYEDMNKQEKYFTDFDKAREYINSIILKNFGFSHQVKIDRIQLED